MNGRKAKERRRERADGSSVTLTERADGRKIELSVVSKRPLTQKELREVFEQEMPDGIPDGMEMPFGAWRILTLKEVLAIGGRREILFLDAPDRDEAAYAEGVGGNEFDGTLFLLLPLPREVFEALSLDGCSAEANRDATAVTLHDRSGAELVTVPLMVSEDTWPTAATNEGGK